MKLSPVPGAWKSEVRYADDHGDEAWFTPVGESGVVVTIPHESGDHRLGAAVLLSRDDVADLISSLSAMIA